MYEEIFSGLETPTEEILKHIEGESHDEMVLLKDIPFYSVCEHHLLPFIGKAHVAYIPSAGKIAGIGELARAVEVLAKKPAGAGASYGTACRHAYGKAEAQRRNGNY